MACPLSALLNPRDVSPIRIIHRRMEQERDHHTELDDDLDAPNDLIGPPLDGHHLIPRAASPRFADPPVEPPPDHDPIPQARSDPPPVQNDYKYPVVLSSKKGSLYSRRTARLADRCHDLLPPPRSPSTPPDSQKSSHNTDELSLSQIHQDLSFGAGFLTDDYLRTPSPEVDFRSFSIFQALHSHPELMFELTRHFDIEDLISLYAISVDFHKLVNFRFTTMIQDQAKARAPESAQIFAYRCYRHLCIRDPMMRPLARIPYQARWVPSFRWLRMIIYREGVVDEIIDCLGSEGLFLPSSARLALKKIWFTLDIGDTRRRISLIHNERFWTDKDLVAATIFLVKLDMRFTDPRTGNGEIGLRRMLLAQPGGLTPLLHVLKRQTLRSPLDMLRLFIRWQYRPRPPVAHLTILGIPADQIGTGHYEGWGIRPERLMGIDTLVTRETVRRNLCLELDLLEMILYGFVDKSTFLDIWHPGAVMDGEAEFNEDLSDANGPGGDEGDDGGNGGGGSGVNWIYTNGNNAGDVNGGDMDETSSSHSSPSSSSTSSFSSVSLSSESFIITPAAAAAAAAAGAATTAAAGAQGEADMDMDLMDTDMDTDTNTDMS